ncbi:MAG: UDP-N-acetylglucosamine 1-carboxyvinyltransferase [Bacteroidetes bacterium]|nr:UDP-N-acetylglucosamine 1-carboxyvinyltransferase [Bacteroidota bacterium]MBR3090454.1 UDP-N-acetylglucosamine 1-carboxyvinyltransferase [Bacteroidota bacterium]
MDKFIIKGGNRLHGRVKISGAKNGALALMPATILAPGTYHLHNTPNLRDVWTMSRLMTELGAFCELNDNDLFIDTTNLNKTTAPYEHVKNMRASFYVLGPLLARFGEAKVSLPGGCAWGPRPVDLHIKGMQKLGADIKLENGYIIAKAEKLIGAKIHLDVSSVGATGNILMAATLAKGTTIISNAATEPEITALARMLVKMGAKINGIGTAILEIEGVDRLNPVDETSIPDRIEAATYLIAAAATGGAIELENVNPYHLTAVIAKLEECGCEINVNSDNIFITAKQPVKKAVDIKTAIYPGIPTDIQAQWTALMACKCEGNSKITDTVYTDRFKHIPELIRLGADIDIVDNSAFVKSSPDKTLVGAQVMASDLRAGAALIIAALSAEGTTEIHRIYHIDRGYEAIEKKLTNLGAYIKRVRTDLI